MEEMQPSHYFTRKWGLEYLISPQSPHHWEEDDIAKCLAAISEKFIRDKTMAQCHLDSFNIFLKVYLNEILCSTECPIFIRNEEHVIYVDSIRVLPPTETQQKTGLVFRLMPDQCHKRHIHYTFSISFDVVYKVFDCPIPFPPNLPVDEKPKFEKEWLKMRDLYRKKVGRQKYYASYPANALKHEEVYRHSILRTIPLLLGSQNCHLQSPLLQPGEGLFEPMANFCVSGPYRLVSPLKDLFINQDFTNMDGKDFTIEVWSASEERCKLHHSTHSLIMYYTKKTDKSGKCVRLLSVALPFTKVTLHICTIFWSLGWSPEEMLVAVRMAARSQWKHIYYEILNVIIQSCKCKSQEDAFLEISEVEQKNLNDPKPFLMESAKLKISQQFLPRLGQTDAANNVKARYLGNLLWKILMFGEQTKPNDPHGDTVVLGVQAAERPIPKWFKVEKSGEIRIKKQHRDHLANCRLDFVGILLASLLRQLWGILWRQIKSHMQATLNANKIVVLAKFFKNNKKLPARIIYCISTGKWAAQKDKDCRKNLTQAFAMNSTVAQESHYTYMSTAMNSDGKNPAPRQINEGQLFNLCPAETPETKKCGLTGHATQVVDFSVGSPASELEKTLHFYQDEMCFLPDFRWVEIYHRKGESGFDDLSIINLNGKPVGFTQFPELFIRFFYQLRRTLTIDPYSSIFYDPIFDIIQLRTDRGRVTTPFLIFSRLHLVLEQLPSNYRDSKVPINYITSVSGFSTLTPAFVGPRALLGLSNPNHPVFSPQNKTTGRRPSPSKKSRTPQEHHREKTKKSETEKDDQEDMETKARRSVLSWNHLYTLGLNTLIGKGLIEYLDAAERKMTVVALNEEDYMKRRNSRGQFVFTHIALDPHFLFSITTGLIPFSNHNQSPRNTYQSAMNKHSVSCNFDRKILMKTSHDLFYCQHPLMNTVSVHNRGGTLNTANMTVIAGCLPYHAYANEDAQIVARVFADRGGGLVTNTKLYRSEHKKKKSSANREYFGKPSPQECVGIKYANYNTVNEDGIAPVGTPIQEACVLIAQSCNIRVTGPTPTGPSEPKKIKDAKRPLEKSKVTHAKKKRRCTSILHNSPEKGFVSMAMKGTNLDGSQFAKVAVSSTRAISRGDKHSSSHGQKGTDSVLLAPGDELEAADGSGLVVEWIINSQGVTKRMTIGHVVEKPFGTAVAFGETRFADATAFRSQMKHIEDLKQTLVRHGFSFEGIKLRDGRTGRNIEALIFVGPLTWKRLKHMIQEKGNARGVGPVSFKTRQPLEGKAKNGGLRFGEMERGCVAAQNAAALMHQIMNLRADAYRISICGKCGIFALAHRSPLVPDSCPACKSSQDVYEVKTVFAYKLLSQEVCAMTFLLKNLVEEIPPPNQHLYQYLDEEDLKVTFGDYIKMCHLNKHKTPPSPSHEMDPTLALCKTETTAFR